jgi:lysozyme
MNRLQKSAAVAGMAAAVVGGFEGLRQTAYPDPATRGPPWTVCYGETAGVKRGDHHSVAECKTMLVASLQKYADAIERCVKVPMPDAREVALVSFAYNVGTGGACGSSVVRLINVGRTREGCDALLHWNRAAGVVFPGLTRRRQAERALCLEGL